VARDIDPSVQNYEDLVQYQARAKYSIPDIDYSDNAYEALTRQEMAVLHRIVNDDIRNLRIHGHHNG